jgi:hypothetical protein
MDSDEVGPIATTNRFRPEPRPRNCRWDSEETEESQQLLRRERTIERIGGRRTEVSKGADFSGWC